MAVTAQFLRNIMAQARPIIERQMDDAKLIAGFRDVVSANGGDWGALKALIKAHVEDENDEAGAGKRVKKIVDKADDTAAYADMLGLANMNENNFSASQSYAEVKGHTGIPILDLGLASTPPGEITEHEQPETPAEEIHERPSTNDKAYLEAVPQDEASLAGTGSRMLAGREGRHEGEAASACLPTHSQSGRKAFTSLAAREADESAAPVPHSAETSPAADKTETAVTPLPAVSGAISDDDVPAFLKKDREPVNERCEKPLTCKYGRHPQKLTCSTCTTAWAIAHRKAAPA